MFSNLGTKIAMKKMGINSDTFNFSSAFGPEPTNKLTKTRKDLPPGTNPGPDNTGETSNNNWPRWMTAKGLPLTVQPWLSPPPPAVTIAPSCPNIGDVAPLDRDRKLTFGGGQRVLVVFLRCVGCAFAQKTFLHLRELAHKSQMQGVTCIAVSHSSAAATAKWIDMLGGAWNVQVVIDEDRAIYAAWGIGLGTVWSYFNPATQTAAWKEKGWLGASVAGAMQRQSVSSSTPTGPGVDGAAGEEGPTTVMGNKWQQAGAFGIDGRGRVIWGGKAKSADDLMDLEAGCKVLTL